MSKVFSSTLKQLEKDIINFGKTGASKRTSNYLAGRLSLLEKTMESATTQFQALVCDDDLKNDEIEAVFEKIRENYFDYRTSLLDAVDKIQPAEKMEDCKPVGDTTTTSRKVDIKLPKINLPVFSGTYETWRAFHDLFVSLIHHNAALSEIEKFHYLKSTVSGEAERILAHLGMDKGNYAEAWSILTGRYDHKRFLVNTQLKCLFNQPSVSQERAESIKQLLDTSAEVVHSLANLKVPVEHWDVVLIFVLLQKLPTKTQQLWEEKLGSKEDSKELPTFAEFKHFLESRFRTLEAVNHQQVGALADSFRPISHRRAFHSQTNSNKITCKICSKGQHAIRKCSRFLKMSVVDRRQNVDKLGICLNCLAYNHEAEQCPSNYRCFYCQQPHHSLLHIATNIPQQYLNSHQSSETFLQPQRPSTSNTYIPARGAQPQRQAYHSSTINPDAPNFQPTSGDQGTSMVNALHAVSRVSTQVLLATAIVKVRSSTGNIVTFRALLDSGSEASFITASAVQLLSLKPRRTNVEVSGLGMVSSGTCKQVVDIVVASRHTDFETALQAFIFKSLSGRLPARKLPAGDWRHIDDLLLADPTFYTPSQVDILLGSDVLAEVLLPGLVRPQDRTLPVAQNTRLGWILFGKAPLQHRPIHSFLQTCDLDEQLQRFWELEEAPFKTAEPKENVECEEQYLKSVKKLADGHYQVSLPFKGNIFPVLGRSYEGAMQRFRSLEKRLAANIQLHHQYTACLDEYLKLGHMVEIREESLVKNNHYFLPHHAVFKQSSSTTKLRVVFDASFRTTDGSSLNDHLMTGPSLQQNVIDVILRWRVYRFTFSADIEKMYRQIWVTQEDSYYQLILWRNNPLDPLKAFRLKTVTFGTAAAPYLAIRTLMEVAKQAESSYPKAAKMIQDEMYVDDLFSGADTVHEAEEKCREIKTVLQEAGFNLRKWMSNNAELLKGIPSKDRDSSFTLPFEASNQVKTLGIQWLPVDDQFCFLFTPPNNPQPTKRFILSTIARLYDPMGWISPCIFQAKCFMQQLWLQKLSWDEEIESTLLQEWNSFYGDLQAINLIRLPRWIHTVSTSTKIELHGFSDASEKGYGAAIYLRSEDEQRKVHMNLLISKSKVAPVKPVSLPRLELCGAVLLARLLKYTAEVLQRGNISMHAWTDSMITLGWIVAPASRWETFIRNRVGEIQRLTSSDIWKHIPTQHNPADLASRGVSPSTLVNATLWWSGPAFLQTDWSFEIPEQPTNLDTDEGKRSIQVHHTEVSENHFRSLIERFSNLGRLVRTLGYCMRFISNLRRPHANRVSGPLRPEETNKAHNIIARCVQHDMFPEGVCRARGMGALNPFSDSEGIIRVGGRLKHADIPYDQQHPIILESRHHFTQMIIRDAHEKTLHGGIQLMICYLRGKYWILHTKRAVKKYLHSCTICYRFRSKAAQQLMGELPAPRVTISRPFTHVGIDYAGPITIRAWKGRGAKCYKGYICVFVCLATKAIHLEASSDLTTQAFLAAFRRFAARRGVCSQIYSDCGTNFVGAEAELGRLLNSGVHDWKEVAEVLSSQGTTWNFIPPASPHFGGLWEAEVKSVKHHFRRIVGNGTLTFEELATLLSQIEACLNSRPLCPLSENPDDFQALTPGHFLIGEPLFTVPEPELDIGKIPYHERWKNIQAHLQAFWKQWQIEYLSRLQQRPKWLKQCPQLKIGDLVLIKDERLPPARWSLGRIVETFPGTDQLTRVVKIKTQQGELRRPVTKLCPLPSNVSSTTTHNQS